MKNSYDMVQNLLNGGLIEMITNKKTKKSKRYTILICCILFYLLLIGLCTFNGIGNFNKNMFLFILLDMIALLLIIDLYRLMRNVMQNAKKAK